MLHVAGARSEFCPPNPSDTMFGSFGSVTHIVPSIRNLYWTSWLYGMGTEADHVLPVFVIMTPFVQPSGAKLPRTSTVISLPMPVYEKVWGQSLSESSHIGGPLPPVPPVPVAG